PNFRTPLIAALVQTKQVAKAVEVCQATPPESLPQAASVLAMALASVEASADQITLADPIFAKAIELQPDNIDLLMAIAGVRFIQGSKYDEVIDLSRRVLAKDSKNILAMNNLASLLAENDSTRDESLQIIDRAIEIGGRTAMLLDTKAVALIHAGK